MQFKSDLVNDFFRAHGVEATDWRGIEKAMRGDDPIKCKQIAASLAIEWTTRKTDPEFTQPSHELVDYVRGVLPGTPGTADPLNLTVTEEVLAGIV